MTRYEKIHEALQEKVNNGILTLEEAEQVNDLAFTKYYGESSDENKDLELIDELRELIEEGKVKLSKDDVKCIKKIIKDAEEDEDDDDDDKSEDEKSKDSKQEETPEEPADGEEAQQAKSDETASEE